jgi:lantibiotic modifying enzyme
LVLYHYALHQVDRDEKNRVQLQFELQRLLEEMLRDDTPAPHTLSLPVIPDLYREGLITPGLDALITQLDRYLFHKASLLISNNNTGSVYGVLGIVHYFVERLPDARIEKYLLGMMPALFKAIAAQFSTAARGLATIDLGMASGISGVLLVLIKACRKGVHEHEIKEIVRQETMKIISYRDEIDFTQKRYSIFPEVMDVKRGEGLFSNTLAWSIGDLNQTLLFYQATALFGDLDLNRMADLVGLNTLLRKDEDATNITDSDFFGGSAGLAQTYGYLAEVTRQKAYQEGYRFWINKTVEFLARELPGNAYEGRELDVLRGLTGVALTLLSYRHKVKWSHCLLL